MWTEQNKRIFFVVVFAIIATNFIAWAVPALYNNLFQPVEWYSQPSMFFRTATNPGQVVPVMASEGYRLPVDIGVASFTGGGGAGTYTLVLPAIASSSTKYVLLATGTRTLLSEIASFTDGDMVMFQMSNSGYWNFGDITAASMKSGYGIYFEGLGDPLWFNLRSGMDMSFAGNTAVSTITVNIVKQQ